MALIKVYDLEKYPVIYHTKGKVEITDFGLKFDDPELEMPVIKTFDKISSFTIEVDVTEDMQEMSASFQRARSDRQARNNTAGQWTV